MTEPEFETVIVIGMPTDEAKRAELAEKHPAKVKPIIYTGSVTMSCTDCQMEVYVGPKSVAVLKDHANSVLLCPWCSAERAKTDEDADVTLSHLDNPESRGFKLACICGYQTTIADDFMSHCLQTGHTLPADLIADLTDGVGLSDFTEMLARIQRDPETFLANEATPVDPDDEDVPDEVRAALAQLEMQKPRPEQPPEGTEMPGWKLRHQTKPYDIEVVLFARQPKGEFRLRRRGEEEIVVRRAIGLEEVVALQAERADILEPLLDAMIAEAERLSRPQ